MEVRNSLASLSDGGTGGGGASSVVVNQKVQNFNQLMDGAMFNLSEEIDNVSGKGVWSVGSRKGQQM